MPTIPRDPKTIFLGMPVAPGGVYQRTLNFLIDLQGAGTGYKFIIAMLQSAAVAKARNILTYAARSRTTASKLLFIDADIVPTVENVVRLLSHADKRIIGGMYPCKQPKLKWVVEGLPEDPDAGKEVRKVKYFGTGMSAWDLSIFDEMQLAHPELAYESDDPEFQGVVMHDFWSMGVVERRYLTEDYYCQHRARALGMDIWIDTLCQVRHAGMVEFPILEANPEVMPT